MKSLSRLPNTVPSQFQYRVRQACVKAALVGEPITYEFLAVVTIGDADRGSADRRFIRLVTKALNDNMQDDIRAGRPLSAVAVRRIDTGLPGDHFFDNCWEIGLFRRDQDSREFVANEWNRFRLYVLCEDTTSHAQTTSRAAA